MTLFGTGGDGYLDWPTASRIASRTDDRVVCVDNFGRREWVEAVGSTSATPVASVDDLIGGQSITFEEGVRSLETLVEYGDVVTSHEDRFLPGVLTDGGDE